MSLIEEIRAELADKQTRTQAGRFLRLTAAGLGAQLVMLGPTHVDGKTLAAMMVGVVEMAWRQWAPTVPWSLVAAKLHLATQQPTAPAAPQQPPAAAE